MFRVLAILMVSVLVFGSVLGDISQDPLKINNLEDMQSDLEKKLQENGIDIPLNGTKIDTEKIENALKEKCKNENAEDAVDELKEQQNVVKDCVTQYINGTQINEELEEAKKTGSMDEVFTKYCKKWPDVYSCFNNVTTTVKKCLNEKEETVLDKSLKIVQDFQEFMCFKEGDRLAMFVAQGGIECLDQQQEGMKECFNATIGGRLPDQDTLSVATLPTFLFEEKDCEDFEKIRLCVNGVLEKCSDTTPANLVDASFKFIRKQMECAVPTVDAKATAVGASTSSAATFRSVLAVTFSVLLLGRVY
ncbi:27 kDa glycoprotein-like [Anthonomus grandis grandis]|uniref:27 kDa glycoprotein-like n=1 Tax=Anthonomus grandis grandis TaxID=2921223 RepID=UPI0021654353|nr:27 kDa glycoprotein-like [Anthonomus grandis grandis]